MTNGKGLDQRRVHFLTQTRQGMMLLNKMTPLAPDPIDEIEFQSSREKNGLPVVAVAAAAAAAA